jgi:uncharacterized protein YcbK (DUF882 family)
LQGVRATAEGANVSSLLTPGRWFKASEFRCKDGTEYPDIKIKEWLDLVFLCDQIRDICGVPLRVVSGYRTERYNRRLAGKSKAHQVASGSAHVKGMAADLAPVDGKQRVNLRKWHSFILMAHAGRELPTLGGLGLYNQWIHVDTVKAADGHLRRWSGR